MPAGLREFDRSGDDGAPVGSRLDREASADRLDAVVHVPHAAALVMIGSEAGAVVAHLEPQHPAGLGQPDPDRARAGVLHGVLERFDAREVHGALDLGRMPGEADRDDMYGNWAAAR